MNARTQVFEFSCEACMVSDIVGSVFSTVLFHRTLGKFSCHKHNLYSLGSVGFQDVDLPVLEVTHVRCSSPSMQRVLEQEVSQFSSMMAAAERPHQGQISLEFYQKKKAKWPFATECMPWEVWTLRMETVDLENERERKVFREKVVDVLTEKLRHVVQAMNRQQYLPHTPPQAELDLVFDTSFPDVQPYLFKVDYQTSGVTNPSVGTAVKKLLKDTLAM
ncbi:Autophagy-related protein 101 [Amphibalanus amphitrite]|uniref:Autophagy-related protein 101 n=1 Tax=Amphibalanus amphitrite TaxID=1232801 RepID=A0A6A4VKW3_AMPAM|nr:autophagy-related protein 101-like [Amphibalanus amphitrite]XP_043194141.1 autophagy-related protein 101-like [Amphibalanus amphitrite]XP_043209220.1 autophagy-related protein 101-like [Amphibalanus amphitrite]XP_043209221.1 autophagy-related protein 101-like [Amphibalanus amphitrite]KAF0291960.1 Autophagy-related protein 101 [Amphibalanus amphitrite]KAF0296126.1 Autophagy-related protein 101 [Amphibalanus amphitrite]